MEIISPKKSITLGLKRYFTGKPCLHGHIAERTLRGSCVACRYERQRKDRRDNPERYLAYSRSYNELHQEDNRLRATERRRADPTKSRRASAKWREANRQKSCDIARAWQKRNPEKALLITQNRRTRKANADGAHTVADIEYIFKTQKYKCVYCGTGLSGKTKHVDHIVPLSLGGSDYRYNIQILCPSCNWRKHAKHPVEYAQSLGLLL